MTLTDKQIADIKLHALGEYPNEACGIISEGKYIPLQNVSPTPKTDFQIADDVWANYKVEAIVHSHPDATDEPSRTDMERQIETDVPWVLCSVKAGVVSNPWVWGDGYIPCLVGRGFRHGPSGSDGAGDCYALIKDWYKQEMNIDLPEFPRDNEWWKNGEDLYNQCFSKAGFRPLMGSEEPQRGDVVLMGINSPVFNHGAVYVENDLILHHLCNRLSRHEPACRWRKMFGRWLRYEKDNTAR